MNVQIYDLAAKDPVESFFDRYGLANTSGEKHRQRKAALTAALVADIERLAIFPEGATP